MGLLDHAAHEFRAELGHRYAAEVAQDGVSVRVFALVAQRLARVEQAHRLRVVERDVLRVDAREVFEVLDHGRVIVTQLVEL